MTRLHCVLAAVLTAFAMPAIALAGQPNGPTISKTNHDSVQNNASTFPAFYPVKGVVLGCSAANGDVARTLYITNITPHTLSKHAWVYWSMGDAANPTGAIALKGKLQLSDPLKPKAMVYALTAPGSAGACRAWTYP